MMEPRDPRRQDPMRRTAALLTAGTAMLALGLSACGGGSDNNVQPPSTDDSVPTQADTTSVPGYTLQPASVGATVSAPAVAKGPAEGDLATDAGALAAATDSYIKAGHTGFADDDNMLDPAKLIAAVGWKAPAGVSVERIDTDNDGGIHYELCLAKATGAWVVYASQQHKVIASGPKNKACGGM